MVLSTKKTVIVLDYIGSDGSVVLMSRINPVFLSFTATTGVPHSQLWLQRWDERSCDFSTSNQCTGADAWCSKPRASNNIFIIIYLICLWCVRCLDDFSKNVSHAAVSNLIYFSPCLWKIMEILLLSLELHEIWNLCLRGCPINENKRHLWDYLNSIFNWNYAKTNVNASVIHKVCGLSLFC